MPAFIHSDRGPSLVSQELQDFLGGKGIAMSHTTAYNPACNGQVEKYNGTVWKAVTMACKSKNLPIKYWQEVLPDVLHSIRSLLCTATNETPHERLFQYARRSTSGSAVPTWLAAPGPVLLKRHVRSGKMEPLVDEVELLGANPNYAHIRYPDGRTTTVSAKHLAPCGESANGRITSQPPNPSLPEQDPSVLPQVSVPPPQTGILPPQESQTNPPTSVSQSADLDTQLNCELTETGPATPTLDIRNQGNSIRRSTRASHPPDRFCPPKHF